MNARVPGHDVSLEGLHQVLVVPGAVEFGDFTLAGTILPILPSLGTDVKAGPVDNDTILSDIFKL